MKQIFNLNSTRTSFGQSELEVDPIACEAKTQMMYEKLGIHPFQQNPLGPSAKFQTLD